MRTSPLSRVLALFVALALFAAACGDDSSSTTDTDPGDDGTVADGGDRDDVDDTNNSPDRGESSDTDGTDGDDTADDMADGDDTADDMADGDVDDGPPTGDVAAYCDFAVQADAMFDEFNPLVSSPAETEDYLRSLLALIEQGRAVAPAEIRDAFDLLQGYWLETVDIVEAAGWDFVAALDALDPLLTDPVYEEAFAALDDFEFDACGIEPEGVVPDDDDDDEQVGFSDSPYCQAAFALAEDDSSIPFGGTPEELQAYYDDVIAALVELHDLAPDELKPDIDVIGEGISTIYVLLESFGFDMDAAFDDFEALVDDPDFFEPMDAASMRLETYDADVCGIII